MTEPPSTIPAGEAPDSEPISSLGPVAVNQTRIEGTILDGRWLVEGVLGEGGTATVYRARDVESGDRVAVKVLHRELASDRTMRERFGREASVANLVQHPAVVQVLADGKLPDQTPYIVMEFLEGETLDARLERKGGRLPATEVLWAIDKVLDALTAAHAKGLVHRDIKPDNIFVTRDRQVKILDFGLARLKQDSESSAKLTRIGVVMGTPSFMPPEQAMGQWDQVDVQTDLWAVGATMFYLLSGRLVHEGDKIHEVVAAATRQSAPSLITVAPHLPDAVVDVVDFALAFEMGKRWSSARLMQHALRKAHSMLMHGEQEPASSEEDPSVGPVRFAPDDAPEPPPLSMRSSHVAAASEVLSIPRMPSLERATRPTELQLSVDRGPVNPTSKTLPSLSPLPAARVSPEAPDQADSESPERPPSHSSDEADRADSPLTRTGERPALKAAARPPSVRWEWLLVVVSLLLLLLVLWRR